MDYISELRELDQEGDLTPEAVLHRASSESSPLHSHFEWDDGEAAHKFRLSQARTLIRSVRIEIERVDVTVRAPKFVRDVMHRKPSEPGYRDILKVKRSKVAARATIHHEIDQVLGHINRAVTVAIALNLDEGPLEKVRRAAEAARNGY